MPILKGVLAASAVAIGGAAAAPIVLMGVATTIADIADRFRKLPKEQRDLLETATADDIAHALLQIDLGARHSAYAAAGVDRIESAIADLNEAHAKATDETKTFLRLLADGLGSVPGRLDELRAQNQRIYAALTSGFVSLESFKEHYWTNAIASIPLLNLKDDDRRVDLLKRSCVGREDELSNMADFMSDLNGRLLYRYGNPGCGKSRLLIEFAERAERAGWTVAFVDGRGDFNLHAALDNLRGQPHRGMILLIWDDWQQQHVEQFKDFLKLHESPTYYQGDVTIKRMVTTWPQYQPAVMREMGDAVGFDHSQLAPLAADNPDFQSLLVDLVGDAIENAAQMIRELMARTGGHPQVALLGVDRLLAGDSIDQLLDGSSIIRQSLGGLVRRLLDEFDRAHLEAFRTLALIMRITNANFVVLGIAKQRPDFLRQLQRLADAGHVARSDGAFVHHQDLMRQFVVKAGFDAEGPLALDDPIEEIVDADRPFLPGWLVPINGIITLAAPAEHSLALKMRLVNEAERRLGELPPDATRDTVLAEALFPASYAGPERDIAERITKLLASLAQRHDPPRPEIDTRWAMALVNAAAREEDPKVRKVIADEIAPIAQRHDPPRAEIDELWVTALYNATCSEEDPKLCKAIADEIATIARRHDPPRPEIDELWAGALFHATIGGADPKVRNAIADEIAVIAQRHDPPRPEIDNEWAKALFNATVGEQDTKVCKAVADEIAAIAQRHDPPRPEIDELWAKALSKATLGEEDPKVCTTIANEIAAIAQRHDPPRPEIDEHWAGALCIATVGERDPRVCRAIADEIGAIAQRHDPPRAEIDELWVGTLRNATLGEEDPKVCNAIAHEIAAIARRHDPPQPEIDETWTKALAAWGLRVPENRHLVIGHIRAIAARHHPPPPAIEKLLALLIDEWGEPPHEQA